ncbi:MAG: molybdenum ABC transporter ATP-binding protein [Thalassovita sp.]
MSLTLSIRHRIDDFTLDADIDAPKGVTVLFGSSGSGKTSIVRAVAGLLRPDSGQARVDGTPLFDTETGHFLPPHKRRVGYVFQEPRLFPHLSVHQNLRYGRWFTKPKGHKGREDDLIDMLGISALLSRRPDGLSGGEKQRVAIGRALLSDPQILLMDEPLAALDAPRKAEILPYLERLRDETEIPILYVSHSASETARLATTVVVMDQGKILTSGPTDHVLADPKLAPVFGLRDAGAVLTGTVVRHHDDGLTELSTAGGPLFLPKVARPIGDNIRIRMLANDVMISTQRPSHISALNVLEARVLSIRDGAGPGALVQLAVGAENILSRVTKRSAKALGLCPGADCFAVVKSVSVAQADIGAARLHLD